MKTRLKKEKEKIVHSDNSGLKAVSLFSFMCGCREAKKQIFRGEGGGVYRQQTAVGH